MEQEIKKINQRLDKFEDMLKEIYYGDIGLSESLKIVLQELSALRNKKRATRRCRPAIVEGRLGKRGRIA